MGSRFVRPDTVTLTISNGDTITVRKRLTAGEKRDAYGRMYLSGADGQMTRHPVLYGIHLVLAYLVDWSLKDDDGKKVEIAHLSVDDLKRVVDSLAHEDFSEILTAIEAHEDAQRAERAKKLLDGESKSAPTSASPSGAAGGSSGSAS